MSLRVLVGVKKVIDYAVKIRVKPDQTGVVTKDVKHSMNPFDEIALEESIKLKEKGIAKSVTAVTCAPEADKDVLLRALAMGADNAIHVKVGSSETLQPLAVARLLTAIIKSDPYDLVFLGKQAIDDDCNQTAQLLAGFLNWPQSTCIASIVKENDGFLIEREIDGGTEKQLIKTPCVLTSDLRLNKPRYPSMANVMKAKSKPIKVLDCSELNVDITPEIKVLSVNEPSKRTGGVVVGSVDELLQKLGEKGLVKF